MSEEYDPEFRLNPNLAERGWIIEYRHHKDRGFWHRLGNTSYSDVEWARSDAEEARKWAKKEIVHLG